MEFHHQPLNGATYNDDDIKRMIKENNVQFIDQKIDFGYICNGKLLLKKDGEIDDGYHRYLTQHVNDEESDDNPAGYDVVSGMRMTDD